MPTPSTRWGLFEVDMANHYILVAQNEPVKRYIPSYSRGFITAGSIFFHKSGQIWELIGLPEKWSIYAKYQASLSSPKIHLFKVGNSSEEELNLSLWDLHLRFGPGSKVVALRRGSDRVIRLRWRRCSLAEIRLREVMEEIEGG